MTKRIVSVIYILTIVVFLPTLTQAYDFTFGENVFLEIKGDVTYTAKFRMEEPSPVLVDESYGNSNFEKYDLVNNRGVARMEVTLDVPYTTFFGRFEAFYDNVFQDDDKYPPGTDIDLAKEYAAAGVEAKEYYADFNIDRLTLRVGKQIVEWGELLAPVYARGVSVINMYDMPKVGTAGYTARDYKVPVMSGWLSYELTDNLSVEGVYSQDFEPRYGVPVVGTFSSFVDALGWGGPTMGLEEQRPTDASDQRQYGAAARMVFPFLREFELGAYWAHYIDSMPFIDISQGVITYEELDMYGLSFSQAFEALWGFQLYGELSYRPEAPAQLSMDIGGQPKPIAGIEKVRTLNWGFGGSMMLSDFFDFTPWTVTFSPILEFYGGNNLDYDETKNFKIPESTTYYIGSFGFSSVDMVDNTVLSLNFTLTGALHSEENSFYGLATTLKARIGDNIELMAGYDIKGGDEEKALEYPGWIPDRDALTLGFTWYFM